MKKYLNKGLVYQWFNSAKSVIFVGLIVWGYLAYDMLGTNINQKKQEIICTFDNYFNTFCLTQYIGLAFIFIVIHFASHGPSKRNNLMFLNSSPYTKKQIKYNEMLCLAITEILFIGVFLYMAVIRYFNYRNFLSIVDGYFQIIGIEVLKMILFGIIGILLMMIIDSMFSNSLAGLIAMLQIIPLSILSIMNKIKMTVCYIAVKDQMNIFQFLDKKLEKSEFKGFVNPLIDTIGINAVNFYNILLNIVICVVIIIIIFIIYNKMQKLNSLEYSTNIFSAKANEKIIRILCSIGVGCFAALIFTSKYIEQLRGTSRWMMMGLTGMNLIKALSVDILSVVIVSFICNFILKKILKIFE